MVTFRKWMTRVHRYLGIALCLLFVVWFLSGIAMIYARGMPRLTAETRMQRLRPIDFTRIRRTPSEAAEAASLGRDPTRLTLSTVLGRPAYRFFVDQTPVTVFADTGELLDEIGPAAAVSIASRFMNLPEAKLHGLGLLKTADQWTIAERSRMPLHKIAVDDDATTELYVSEPFGEVVLETTRGSRALAWVAAILHWFYFAPLRSNDSLWRQVVLWTSGLGTISALIGLALAVTQYRWRYVGWTRWHYVAGVSFGVITLTWVFSGLLSMEPWFWASGGGTGGGIREALSGGALDPWLFPAFDADR